MPQHFKRFTFNQAEASREDNKMGLTTFSFDKYNMIDSPIDKLIGEIKFKIEETLKSIKIGWNLKKAIREI